MADPPPLPGEEWVLRSLATAAQRSRRTGFCRFSKSGEIVQCSDGVQAVLATEDLVVGRRGTELWDAEDLSVSNVPWARSGLSVSRVWSRNTRHYIESESFEEDGGFFCIMRNEAKTSLRDWIMGTSHDMRTPLSGILAASELLGQSEVMDVPETAFLVHAIHSSCKVVLGIVHNMGDVKTLDGGGGLKFRSDWFSLVDLLQECVQVCRLASPVQGSLVLLDVESISSLPEMAQGDRGKIAQIITNLLLHAMKSSEGTPVEVRTLGAAEQSHASREHATFPLLLAVQYGGRGMTSEESECLFNSYDSPGALKGAANGHWLFVSREIARAMGGDITVEAGVNQETRLLLRLPLEIEEESLMLVRSTSEGGEQEQGLCGSAGVSRRFPLTLPSLSAGDLHVKQTAGCWVAKAAASKASSVSWLGLEDLSAGGQGFGHPAQPVRDVLDSATSAEDADAADAVALRAQLGPAPASRPPQSDALGVPPGSSPGLWRSDSAQAALFATHAQGARAKVESDTESAGGVLWPDGDLAIAFDETLEHGDFPRDSVLERSISNPLESPPESPRPASLRGALSADVGSGSNDDQSSPSPGRPHSFTTSPGAQSRRAQSVRRLSGRHASGSLIPIGGRGGPGAGAGASPKYGDLRASASEEQLGLYAGTPRSQRSPGASPRHPVHPHQQTAQPVPILPSSCSAVACFRMAMDGRSRGPEAKSLFVSRGGDSLARHGSTPLLRGGNNILSVSDFGSFCSTEGTDEGFWGAGSGRGRGRGSDTGVQSSPRERSIDDLSAVAEEAPPGNAAPAGGLVGTPMHSQLATWAEAGPPQPSEWATPVEAGVSLLGDKRPLPPVSSLSLLLRRASSSPDVPDPPGRLWRGSLDGTKSEGNRHSDIGEQPFARLREAAEPAAAPMLLQSVPPPKEAEEGEHQGSLPDCADILGTSASAALLLSPPSVLAGASSLQRAANAGLAPRSPAWRVSSGESLSTGSPGSEGPLVRLLYVEDHHLIRVLVSRVLEKNGFEVTTAVDGVEGLKMLKDASLQFDLCVSDLDMPNLAGDQMVAQYREWEASTRPGWRLPIVALTANGNESVMQLCHDAGMDLFLNKPFRNSDVQSLLTLLDESAAHQELRSPGQQLRAPLVTLGE